MAWSRFIIAHARLTAILNREMAERGLLSLEWYDVLLALKRAPQMRLRLSELAQRVVLSRSGLTRMVDRLESAGYLRRTQAEEDRRGAYALLLPAGDEAMARAWPTYEQLILEHFGRHFSDDEAQTLNRVLARLAGVGQPEPVDLTIRRKPKSPG